jgi:hypothetical protein
MPKTHKLKLPEKKQIQTVSYLNNFNSPLAQVCALCFSSFIVGTDYRSALPLGLPRNTRQRGQGVDINSSSFLFLILQTCFV